MAISKFKAKFTDSYTNNKFYGSVKKIDVVESTFVSEYDKRIDFFPADFSGSINLRHDVSLEMTCDSFSFSETGENTYSVFFSHDAYVYELWAGISGRKVVNFGLNEWLSYADFENGDDADFVYRDTDFATFDWQYIPLTNEEIAKLVALTDVQKQLVKEFGNLIKEMEEKGVRLVYDSFENCGAAINVNNLTKLTNEPEELDENPIDLEGAIEWGNIENFDKIYEYNPQYYPLSGNIK